MAFTEDLTVFFDEFAVSAVFHLGGMPAVNLTRNVIKDDPTEDVQTYDTSIEARAPTLRVATADIPGVVRGMTVTINSVTYKIERVRSMMDGATSQVDLKT